MTGSVEFRGEVPCTSATTCSVVPSIVPSTVTKSGSLPQPHNTAGDKRGESSAHTRFPHNFHLFSRKNTIFSINLLFLDAKLKIIVNYEL